MRTDTNGVIFGNKHSYDDFELILTEKSIPMPVQKRNKISMLGANGDVDLSTVNTGGEPTYENRLLTFKFDLLIPVHRRAAMYSKIANHLHGRTLQIIVDEDPGYFYVGCCELSSNVDKAVNHSEIVISVDAEPFKYSLQETTEEWLWDPFNFETGIIYKALRNVHISGDVEFDVPVHGMPIVPTIVSDVPVTVTYKGIEYEVPAGSHLISNVVLTENSHVISIAPTEDELATVSIKFRGGIL